MCGRVSPLKPELVDGRLTEHVELKANPYEGEKQAKCRKNEAIEFETPSEGGDPGTPQLDLKTLRLLLLVGSQCCFGPGSSRVLFCHHFLFFFLLIIAIRGAVPKYKCFLFFLIFHFLRR